jgi:hypothetical protein
LILKNTSLFKFIKLKTLAPKSAKLMKEEKVSLTPIGKIKATTKQ